jgi:hypothetical protein
LNGNLIHYHEGIPPKKKENSPINKLSFIWNRIYKLELWEININNRLITDASIAWKGRKIEI